MHRLLLVFPAVALALVLAADDPASDAPARDAVLPKWENGFSVAPEYFPLAVWCQSPRNAARYKALGFNLYVALWKGPTDEQLDELKKHGMPVICSQNEVGLRRKDDGIIVGWMHGDEPDNAQSFEKYWKTAERVAEGWPEYRDKKWKTYGPPVPPKWIANGYAEMKKNDPARPVLLNLGQGVAWDGWHGRGVRTNRPEDYAEYVKGADVVSFDIYPAVHSKPEVAGKLYYVAEGVKRLKKLAGGRRIVWNCIECTRIDNPNVKPTPRDVRAEVWMSIVNGSRGLIYFAHQFQPKMIEAGLLADEEMSRAVAKINAEVTALAPVINAGEPVANVVTERDPAEVPVDFMVVRHDGDVYVFAVAMRGVPVRATFEIPGLGSARKAETIGAAGEIEITGGRLELEFDGWEVKLLRIRSAR